MLKHQTDILVLGSGIAGLTFSIKLALQFPQKKICIITKSDESESNTKYAQGGIAVVQNELSDSFEKHIADTLRAGDGLCDEEVVRMVVHDGPGRLNEIIGWGVEFDKDQKGKFFLGKEGGHSENRILHFKDITGLHIELKLLDIINTLPNIQVYTQHFAIDLITEHQLKTDTTKGTTCYGAYVLNKQTNGVETFSARVTMLATGGIGQIYKTTTNPTIATGDGIAMAYRAKAMVSDMEFIQFHPTALYNPNDNPAFLITEAMRGAGAYLINHAGERFVLRYDERGELASRDIVAMSIDRELKKSGKECVFLDCRHIHPDTLQQQFPNIREKCASIGIRIENDLIPVVPAAHYLCGGIQTNVHAQTTIKHLYACGECARTGLHGANRLASNSLLEALVFTHHAFAHVSDCIEQIELPKQIPDWDSTGMIEPEENILITYYRTELKNLMSDFVGIVRSDARLQKAELRLQYIFQETEAMYKTTVVSQQLCELRNMVAVAYLVIKQSKNRKENKGGFFNINLAT